MSEISIGSLLRDVTEYGHGKGKLTTDSLLATGVINFTQCVTYLKNFFGSATLALQDIESKGHATDELRGCLEQIVRAQAEADTTSSVLKGALPAATRFDAQSIGVGVTAAPTQTAEGKSQMDALFRLGAGAKAKSVATRKPKKRSKAKVFGISTIRHKQLEELSPGERDRIVEFISSYEPLAALSSADEDTTVIDSVSAVLVVIYKADRAKPFLSPSQRTVLPMHIRNLQHLEAIIKEMPRGEAKASNNVVSLGLTATMTSTLLYDAISFLQPLIPFSEAKIIRLNNPTPDVTDMDVKNRIARAFDISEKSITSITRTGRDKKELVVTVDNAALAVCPGSNTEEVDPRVGLHEFTVKIGRPTEPVPAEPAASPDLAPQLAELGVLLNDKHLQKFAFDQTRRIKDQAKQLMLKSSNDGFFRKVFAAKKRIFLGVVTSALTTTAVFLTAKWNAVDNTMPNSVLIGSFLYQLLTSDYLQSMLRGLYKKGKLGLRSFSFLMDVSAKQAEKMAATSASMTVIIGGGLSFLSGLVLSRRPTWFGRAKVGAIFAVGSITSSVAIGLFRPIFANVFLGSMLTFFAASALSWGAHKTFEKVAEFMTRTAISIRDSWMPKRRFTITMSPDVHLESLLSGDPDLAWIKNPIEDAMDACVPLRRSSSVGKSFGPTLWERLFHARKLWNSPSACATANGISPQATLEVMRVLMASEARFLVLVNQLGQLLNEESQLQLQGLMTEPSANFGETVDKLFTFVPNPDTEFTQTLRYLCVTAGLAISDNMGRFIATQDLGAIAKAKGMTVLNFPELIIDVAIVAKNNPALSSLNDLMIAARSPVTERTVLLEVAMGHTYVPLKPKTIAMAAAEVLGKQFTSDMMAGRGAAKAAPRSDETKNTDANTLSMFDNNILMAQAVLPFSEGCTPHAVREAALFSATHGFVFKPEVLTAIYTPMYDIAVKLLRIMERFRADMHDKVAIVTSFMDGFTNGYQHTMMFAAGLCDVQRCMTFVCGVLLTNLFWTAPNAAKLADMVTSNGYTTTAKFTAQVVKSVQVFAKAATRVCTELESLWQIVANKRVRVTVTSGTMSDSLGRMYLGMFEVELITSLLARAVPPEGKIGPLVIRGLSADKQLTRTMMNAYKTRLIGHILQQKVGPASSIAKELETHPAPAVPAAEGTRGFWGSMKHYTKTLARSYSSMQRMPLISTGVSGAGLVAATYMTRFMSQPLVVPVNAATTGLAFATISPGEGPSQFAFTALCTAGFAIPLEILAQIDQTIGVNRLAHLVGATSSGSRAGVVFGAFTGFALIATVLLGMADSKPSLSTFAEEVGRDVFYSNNMVQEIKMDTTGTVTTMNETHTWCTLHPAWKRSPSSNPNLRSLLEILREGEHSE